MRGLLHLELANPIKLRYQLSGFGNANRGYCITKHVTIILDYNENYEDIIKSMHTINQFIEI